MMQLLGIFTNILSGGSKKNKCDYMGIGSASFLGDPHH